MRISKVNKQEKNLDATLYEVFEDQIEYCIDENGKTKHVTTKEILKKKEVIPHIRGLQKRFSAEVPWKQLPVITEFEIKNNEGENLILKYFGIKSRNYHLEKGNQENSIEMIVEQPLNGERSSEVNEYLKKQIMLLQQNQQKEEFWRVINHQMGCSAEFFLLNLANWNPIWYKELSLNQIIKIILDYDKCVRNQDLPSMKEVWIQDGRKWRVLGIPKPGVRLFLSGLNKILMLWVNSFLESERYHGFMFGRGVNTFWKTLIKKKELKSYCILEVDLSANFNNVRKDNLYKQMETDLKIPSWILSMIHKHLSVKIEKTPVWDLPSEDGQIERILNKDFNEVIRNLPQGLSISPILSIINTKFWIQALREEFQLSYNGFSERCYADDITILIDEKNFLKISEKNIIDEINNSKSSKKYGIVLDKDKSSIVKKGNILYKKKIKILGIEYDFSTNNLNSSTRGRNFNPITKRKERKPQETYLNFPKSDLVEKDEDIIKTDLKFLLQYKELTLENLFKEKGLIKYFNTIIAILFKGPEKVRQNFSIKKSKPNSLLWKITQKKNLEGKNFLNNQKITSFTVGQYYIYSLLQIMTQKKLINNIIVMGELKSLNEKILKKISNVIKVPILSDKYECEEWWELKGEPGETYKKVKYASDDEKRKALELIKFMKNEKQNSRKSMTKG